MMYVFMQTPSGPMLVPVQTQTLIIHPHPQEAPPCFTQSMMMMPSTTVEVFVPYFPQPMMQASTPGHEYCLVKQMEWYLRDHCGGGSASFVRMQRSISDSAPHLVEKVIPAYENSWHRFLPRCPSLVLFHYSHADVVRLNLATWMDEHEARIRLEKTLKSVCDGHDAARAAEFASKLHELLDACVEAVNEKGTVEVAALLKILVEKLPFFNGITKSSLKRVLSRSPNSGLWVSGNILHSIDLRAATGEPRRGGSLVSIDGDSESGHVVPQ